MTSDIKPKGGWRKPTSPIKMSPRDTALFHQVLFDLGLHNSKFASFKGSKK